LVTEFKKNCLKITNFNPLPLPLPSFHKTSGMVATVEVEKIIFGLAKQNYYETYIPTSQASPQIGTWLPQAYANC